MIRVAINGYGRIGRAVLRALYEQKQRYPIQIVAINGMGSLAINAHLTQYDTTHGKFQGMVDVTDDGLLINDTDHILFFSQKEVNQLPWKALDIDIVYECTGKITERHAIEQHLAAGAQKVLISAPSKSADATIIYGVNHHTLCSSHRIISMASCTTNALASMIHPLQEHITIEQGLVTTIHAYTNDQRLLDSYHIDPYRSRSATQSMIPSKTGATEMIEVIFPHLKNKLKGLAIRVPVPNVSLVDFTFTSSFVIDASTVNTILERASQKSLHRILDHNTLPLVSSDFNHHAASAIILSKETMVTGQLIKVLAWYDNEWGFSNRMLDITMAWFS